MESRDVSTPKAHNLFGDGNKDFEFWIPSESSSDVFHGLRAELLNLCQERFGPTHHIDLQAFDAIGPAVDWGAVLARQ
jgi:hypothetical protein